MLPVLRKQTEKDIRLKTRLIPDTKVVRREMNDSIAEGENNMGPKGLIIPRCTGSFKDTFFFRL